MLVLKRNDGQWTDIVHAKSGELVRVRVQKIDVRGSVPSVDLVFDDDARHFAIHRPERKAVPPDAGQGVPDRPATATDGYKDYR